jgi:enoyl-CoA hydratase/carnithine racemase
MPEVTIALFPDVGGSWFLNHMPGKSGEFLALTGASVNAADAIFAGIADRFISSEHKDAVLQALLAQDLSGDAHAAVRHALRPFSDKSIGSLPAGQVEPHLAAIGRLCDGDSIHDIIDNITGLDTEDPWLAKARDSLAHGSKLAARWIHRQLWETRHASLREVFQAEIQLVTNIVRHPEFAEGVRALLIDKDRNPQWAYPSSREVPEDVLDNFFAPLWPDNPLADL